MCKLYVRARSRGRSVHAGNLARSDIIAAVLFATFASRLRCISGMQQHFGVIAFEHTLGARAHTAALSPFFGRGLLRNIARSTGIG